MATTPPTSPTKPHLPLACIDCTFCCMHDCACAWGHPMPQGYATPICTDFEPQVLNP